MTVEHTAPLPHRPTGWCSIAQAATALSVSRDTIRRMIDRGELYAERLGPRLVRVDLNSIRPTPLGPSGQTSAAARLLANSEERLPSGRAE
ncbi:helix-turn-helix domain-containing protein [uncultured Microbacterium sp.]|uniref:helix-turn-helix domain-containing protein n=1 Tax=uncultured Microbacterium sp. TaxID=191216 RepID=UPI0025DE70C1|nr:helix-turn-helix domain-containing protein [uncultured Microbacterium sp.]